MNMRVSAVAASFDGALVIEDDEAGEQRISRQGPELPAAMRIGFADVLCRYKRPGHSGRSERMG